MGVEDQGPNDHLNNYLWENQSWAVSDSENSSSDDEEETNKNKLLDITTAPQRNKGVVIIDGGGEGEESNVRNRNKRSRGGDGMVIRNNNKGKRVVNGGREADHELHIWTERERRKKMRNMFANLHALLPNLPSKADKSSIVDEAVNYIKSLEKSVGKMEKRKREKDEAVSPIGCESSVTVINAHWNPYLDYSSTTISDQASSSSPVGLKTFVSPNLVLTMSGDNEAEYNICAPKKQGLFTTISFVLEKYKLDVLYASMFSTPNANKYMIVAHANKALVQFPDGGSVEQTFRRAAGEIVMWLS